MTAPPVLIDGIAVSPIAGPLEITIDHDRDELTVVWLGSTITLDLDRDHGRLYVPIHVYRRRDDLDQALVDELEERYHDETLEDPRAGRYDVEGRA